jgi:hypothetical protein
MNGKYKKMNIETHKKWFVYVDDHHEGPYSLQEVALKKSQGIVTDETFVWCEGMGDWAVITGVTELYSGLQLMSAHQPEAASSDASSADESANAALESTLKTAETSVNSVHEQKNTEQFANSVSHSKPFKTKSSSSFFKTIKNLVIALIVLLVATSGAIIGTSRIASEPVHSKLRPLFFSLVNRLPALSRFIQVIPPLPDLKPEQIRELEQAMLGDPDDGVRVAFILSTQDPQRPYFYVTSNLPDNTKLEIILMGRSETLLNTLHYNTQTVAIMRSNFARSEIILGDGGQPVPKGEYRAILTESQEQDDAVKLKLGLLNPVKNPNVSDALTAQFVFYKEVFLGGTRDETYLTRLKAFHEKLNEAAAKELTELKQYSGLLDSQINSISAQFMKIFASKKISSAQKSTWAKVHANTGQILLQLDQSMSSWNPDTLKSDFFYGKLFELVKGGNESLKKLVALENSYIQKPSDKISFSIQHGKALAEAKESAELLHTKLDVYLKKPKDSIGLPNKEGL